MDQPRDDLQVVFLPKHWKIPMESVKVTLSFPGDLFEPPFVTIMIISKKTPTYPWSIPQESLNPQMKGIPS